MSSVVVKGLNNEKPVLMNQNVSMFYKAYCLVTLVFISSATVLTLRYSRTVSTDGPRYLNSSAVAVAEVLKMFFSFLCLFIGAEYSLEKTKNLLWHEMFTNWNEMVKMAVPAVLYVVQNNLLFLALSNLDAATYQVTYQCKIFTTAVLSVLMLGKRLNSMKWFALAVLMSGVVIVQLPADGVHSVAKLSTTGSQVVGLIAVFVACITSGFSGVYLEVILKTTQTSLWVRNLQLALFSIIPAVGAMIFNDWAAISRDGVFQGYTGVTWLVILFQAAGGIVISLVVKYADNILKVFATSVSIVLSCILSYVLLNDFQPTATFVLGAALVIGSTFLYGYEKPIVKN